MDNIIENLEKLHQTPITNVRPITEGWEAEIYAYETPDHAYILRLFPSTDGDTKAKKEFVGMQKLHTLDYPVPQVHQQSDAANSLFGLPYITMDYAEGELLGNTEGDCLPVVCRLLRDLHKLKWQGAFDFPSDNLDAYADSKFAEYIMVVETILPEFKPLLDWSIANRQTATRYSLLHGDFHPWNIIQSPDGKHLTVIDWSSLEVGDPQFDVAWTWMLIGTALGMAEGERFLQLWGESLPNFYKVLAITRRLGSMYLSMQGGAENMGMRPGAEEKMRRQLRPLGVFYAEMKRITGVSIPLLENFLT